MKETFIVRTEWMKSISKMDTEGQAAMLMNLFHYHAGNHNLINLTNPIVELVWDIIEPNLLRNIEDYDRRRDTSSENGKKGGRPRKATEPPGNNLNKPNSEPNNLPIPNESLSVSVSVTDTGSVSDSVFNTHTQSADAKKDFDFTPYSLRAQQPPAPEPPIPQSPLPPVAPPPSPEGFVFPGKPKPTDIGTPPEYVIAAVQEGQYLRSQKRMEPEKILAYWKVWLPANGATGDKYVSHLSEIHGHFINHCNKKEIPTHEQQPEQQHRNTFGRSYPPSGQLSGTIIDPGKQFHFPKPGAS